MRLTQAEVVLALKAACDAAGGQRAWSRKHGISSKWINNVLRGRQSISPGLTLALGYRRVIEYEPIAHRTQDAA